MSEYAEEWDLDGLQAEVSTFWPTEVTLDELRQCYSTDELYDRLMGEATGYYEQREVDLEADVLRQIER